jgi:hypothetical protein
VKLVDVSDIMYGGVSLAGHIIVIDVLGED